MSLKQLFDFLSLPKSGLARVLGVSHGHISPANVSLHNGTLRYQGKHKDISMGMLFAILDEMTTNALFLHKCPTPPGSSIHIRLELAAKAANRQASLLQDEFVMDSSVIKAGKTVAFLDCQIFDTDGDIIAFGSQVKYLPTGSWFTDKLFTSPLLWNLFTNFYANRTKASDLPEVHPIQEYLKPDSQSIGRAVFRVTPFISNPFGALHGGAQGMMMEMVGRSLAKAVLKTDAVELTSLQVDYLAIGRDEVEVTAQEIAVQGDTAQLLVQIAATKSGRTVSSGHLRFIKANRLADASAMISRM